MTSGLCKHEVKSVHAAKIHCMDCGKAFEEDPPFDYSQLDPGIRAVVKRLRDNGWETTDSGDGKSKPVDWFLACEALTYPHVVIKLNVPHYL